MPFGNGWKDLDEKTLVSMNFWGYMPGYLDEIEEAFPIFLKYALRDNPMKGEFLLPTFVGRLIDAKKISLKVLSSPDTWFGVTYAADKPKVVEALRKLTEEGKYPNGLWAGNARCKWRDGYAPVGYSVTLDCSMSSTIGFRPIRQCCCLRTS